jgi:hypothetical protein
LVQNNYAVIGCVVYNIPVDIRPDGMPIGEISSEAVVADNIIRLKQKDGYSYIVFLGKHDGRVGPFDLKSLAECG